jgi:hypothetical protein
MALIEKFPILNYLDKNVDGINGKAPYVSLFEVVQDYKDIRMTTTFFY